MNKKAKLLQRAATDTIRGFVAQLTLCALRWVEAPADWVVTTEGIEDIDAELLIDGVVHRTAESVKDIGGKLSARHEAVYETVAHFAAGHIAAVKAGTPTRFVFTTTALRSRQNKKGKVDLPIDILETWQKRKGEALPKLVSATKALLQEYVVDNEKKSERFRKATKEALAALDDNDLWSSFFDVVEWRFGSPRLDLVNLDLVSAVASLPCSLPNGRIGPNLAPRLAEAIVLAVMRRSCSPRIEDRRLSRDDLQAVVRHVCEEYEKNGEIWMTLRLVSWTKWQWQILAVARSPSNQAVAALYAAESEPLEETLRSNLSELLADPGLRLEVRRLLEEGKLYEAATSSELAADRLTRPLLESSADFFVGLCAEEDLSKRLRDVTRNRLKGVRLKIVLGAALPDDADWARSGLSEDLSISTDLPVTCWTTRMIAQAFENSAAAGWSPDAVTARLQPRVRLLVDREAKPHRQGSHIWKRF